MIPLDSVLISVICHFSSSQTDFLFAEKFTIFLMLSTSNWEAGISKDCSVILPPFLSGLFNCCTLSHFLPLSPLPSFRLPSLVKWTIDGLNCHCRRPSVWFALCHLSSRLSNDKQLIVIKVIKDPEVFPKKQSSWVHFCLTSILATAAQSLQFRKQKCCRRAWRVSWINVYVRVFVLCLWVWHAHVAGWFGVGRRFSARWQEFFQNVGSWRDTCARADTRRHRRTAGAAATTTVSSSQQRIRLRGMAWFLILFRLLFSCSPFPSSLSLSGSVGCSFDKFIVPARRACCDVFLSFELASDDGYYRWADYHFPFEE